MWAELTPLLNPADDDGERVMESHVPLNGGADNRIVTLFRKL